MRLYQNGKTSSDPEKEGRIEVAARVYSATVLIEGNVPMAMESRTSALRRGALSFLGIVFGIGKIYRFWIS
jgi:hypothetical protein